MTTNTLAIGRPSQDAMASANCSSSCSDLGPVDPLNKAKLGPRPNREKVREQIKDYILLMMGAPVVRLEIDQQGLDLCVDQALKIIEDYAPREYFSWYKFLTTPGKSVYELPPDVGLVRKVSYRETASPTFQAQDLGGVIPIEYYTNSSEALNGGLFTPNAPVWGRMGEWVLYKQYETMFSRVSSQLGGWEWVGGLRHIKLYPVPCGVQTVNVHYIQRNKDWQDVTQAMQELALTYAKEIIGRIRSKYGNPPGPNGGIQLDGQALLQEAREDREKCFENLIYKFGDLPPITMG